MILLSHPFGNANVRAVLQSLEEANLLAQFVTTLGYPRSAAFLSFLPPNAQRRAYDLPPEKVRAYPTREIIRLLAGAAGITSLVEHERGWASIDRVWQALDEEAASWFRAQKTRAKIDAVYAYEDCALRLFEAAQGLGARRIYDLPIAYYETAQRILREEAERYPDWEPTLGGTRDSEEKLARKQREMELAELVVCPSNFVLESVPAGKNCVVAPFGSPSHTTDETYKTYESDRLRVLFAGSMTQRKGLADLFAAMKLINSPQRGACRAWAPSCVRWRGIARSCPASLTRRRALIRKYCGSCAPATCWYCLRWWKVVLWCNRKRWPPGCR